MVAADLQTLPIPVQEALLEITDPEIPVLSIMDMGVVREVTLEKQHVYVKLTPTYSGCPAMDTMAVDIKRALEKRGYSATVKLVLAPAWTTDWITPAGRAALEAYGIAAPLDAQTDKYALIDGKRVVKCTNCGSTNTKMISQFGSTACKALFQCDDCLEPFDYFKCLK
jgi:ring-1,2-phenylacetyl-CoA epoxidase subunit PaaD